MPIQFEYILFVLIVLVISYFVFYKKETFINRKLENFNGDDLNVHRNDDLNIIKEADNQAIIE